MRPFKLLDPKVGERLEFIGPEFYNASPLLVASRYLSFGEKYWKDWDEFNMTTVLRDSKRSWPDREIHFLHPEMSNEVREWMKHLGPLRDDRNSVPSAGFMAVAIAMLHCKRINAYEFFPSRRETLLAGKGEMFNEHYYEKDPR